MNRCASQQPVISHSLFAIRFSLFAFFTLLAAFPAPARATKLDLSSNVDVKAVNYTNLQTGGEKKGAAFYSENATLGFVIKDIKLEKTTDSSMDVGIVLNSVGTGSSSSSDTLNSAQFQEAVSRYPNTTGAPFVKEAYVRIYKFLTPRVTATLGRQAFMLGQGIALADDGIGLPGARLEIAKIFKVIKGEFFFFQPYQGDIFTKITGGGIYYPSNEGLWHFYHFWEQTSLPQGVAPMDGPGYTFISRTRKLTGIRYFLNHSQLNFDGEAVVQKGLTRQPDNRGRVDYLGYAFLIKGSWSQDVKFFGTSKMRMAFGKSSGNSGPVSDKDKAFLPTFGHKFKGVERDGFGEIAGATLYSIIQTSGTVNGLPNGVSGLNIINVGLDMPYKKIMLSVDLVKIRASQNANDGATQVAREWDFKATYPMGDSLKLKAVYALFKPLSLYDENTTIKLVSIGITAKF